MLLLLCINGNSNREVTHAYEHTKNTVEKKIVFQGLFSEVYNKIYYRTNINNAIKIKLCVYLAQL